MLFKIAGVYQRFRNKLDHKGLSTKKKGFRVYQMEQMAELEEDDTETSVFDLSMASTYSYRYDSGNIKQYVYSALEALCYECGCFLWSDLGMLSVHFIIHSFI